MIRVGLTGGIGAGKSLVLAQLRRLGVPTLSTDEVAHRQLALRPVRRLLVKRFGRGVLGARGTLDRAKLAAKVFASDRDRRFLEKALHPRIRREVDRWERGLRGRAKPPRVAVVEVPLLFEAGWDRSFDGVLAVAAPRPQRWARLRRRGWGAAEIRRREKTQWPADRKNRNADWVLWNDGSPGRLARRVTAWREAFSGKRKP